jgi:hypothetical protein
LKKIDDYGSTKTHLRDELDLDTVSYSARLSFKLCKYTVHIQNKAVSFTFNFFDDEQVAGTDFLTKSNHTSRNLFLHGQLYFAFPRVRSFASLGAVSETKEIVNCSYNEIHG